MSREVMMLPGSLVGKACNYMNQSNRYDNLSSENAEGSSVPADTFTADTVYDLFISYRRSDAAPHATALRRWLKKYRLPRTLRTKERTRDLSIYIDEVNVRARSDFMQEIVPALGRSRYLLILLSNSAHKPGRDGEPNWLVRELRVFRDRRNPRRDQVVAAIVNGDLDAELPDRIDKCLPRIERLDVRDLMSLWQWWPPKRLEIESELLPLVATLRDIEPEAMETLRREAERGATQRLVTMLSSALAIICALAVALILAVVSQIEATQSNFEAQFAQSRANRSAADAIAINAQVARQRGDYLGSVRLLAQAQSLAWSPRVQANALSLDQPLALFDHVAPIKAWKTAFSPDGKLALGRFDGEVILYDPDDRSQVSIRQADGIPVVSLSFELSGDLLVVVRSPADAAWNNTGLAEHASRLERISPSGDVIDLGLPPSGAFWLSVAASGNAMVLAAGADDGVWTYDSRRQNWLRLSEVDGAAKPNEPVSVAVSAGGDFVAASTIEGAITVWRVGDQQVMGRWVVPKAEGMFPYNPFKLGFMPHGTDLVFGSFAGAIHRWNFNSGEDPSVLSIPHRQAVTSIALTADGRRLVSGSWDGFSAVMETASPTTAQLQSIGPEELRAGVMDLAISPDGAWLATTEAVPRSRSAVSGRGNWIFGSVRLWRLRAPEPARPAWEEPFWAVDFDPSGVLVSARAGRPTSVVREGRPPTPLSTAVNVWDPVVESQRAHGPTRSLRVDDGGGRLGDYVSVPFRHRSGAIVTGSMAFSPSGQRAAFLSATVSDDRTSLQQPEIVLFDVQTGRVVQRKRLALAATQSFGPLMFADDETVLASLTATSDTPDDRRGSHVWSWNAKSDLINQIITLRENAVYDMAISSANTMIALSDDNHSVIVVDLGGREIWRAPPDRRLANAPAQLAFSPDGRHLFAASFAQLSRWEIANGWNEVRGSVGINFRPQDIEVDPSARLLVIADLSGVLRFIDASSLEEIRLLETDVGPLIAISISPDGRRLATIGVRGHRLLGGILPTSIKEAERMSRLTVGGGALARLSPEEEARLITQIPEPNEGSTASPEDAVFLGLVQQGGIVIHRPDTWVDWLLATEPVSVSDDMETWLLNHSEHPFSSNLLQWGEPRNRQD